MSLRVGLHALDTNKGQAIQAGKLGTKRVNDTLKFAPSSVKPETPVLRTTSSTATDAECQMPERSNACTQTMVSVDGPCPAFDSKELHQPGYEGSITYWRTLAESREGRLNEAMRKNFDALCALKVASDKESEALGKLQDLYTALGEGDMLHIDVSDDEDENDENREPEEEEEDEHREPEEEEQD